MHKYIEGSVTTLTFVFSSKNKKSKTCTRGPPGALQARSTSHSGEVGARVGLVFKNTKVCAKKTDNIISTFVRYYHTVCTYEGRPFTYVTTKYSCTVQYNSNNLRTYLRVLASPTSTTTTRGDALSALLYLSILPTQKRRDPSTP